MGSFNSSPKIFNVDSQDDDLKVPQGCHAKDLLHHFKLQSRNDLRLLERYFLKQTESPTLSENITDGLSALRLNSVSRGSCHPRIEKRSTMNNLRILQWNILSQSKLMELGSEPLIIVFSNSSWST